MDLLQLLQLKAKLHDEMLKRADSMEFSSEDAKRDYINTSIEAQAEFFVYAMIDILDSEIDSETDPKKKSA